MMASIVPFRPEHISGMTVKADAQSVAASPVMVSALEKVGHTLLTNDGRVLAVIGAVPTVPNVCEVFILASEEQKSHPITFARLIKREVFTLRRQYRRIQSVSKVDDFHYRWLSWLGFRAEGILKAYGMDGEDMIMWGLTE
jgi:hypothetical protein